MTIISKKIRRLLIKERKKMGNNFDFVINFRIHCRAPGHTGDALSHAGC